MRTMNIVKAYRPAKRRQGIKPGMESGMESGIRNRVTIFTHTELAASCSRVLTPLKDLLLGASFNAMV